MDESITERPGNPSVTVRFPVPEYERIEREAEERDRSLAYIVREYTRKGMERAEKV